MKNSRAVAMLAIAVLAGLGSVVFAARWLMQTSSAGVAPVVVAVADVNLGQPLAPEMLRTVNWPSGSVPPGAFADPKVLDGRVLRTSLGRGEPVLESKLALQSTK